MQKQLTTGPVMPTMLQFAVPMILGDLLQQCYNIADTLIVGRFIGTGALAAVGSAFTLMTFLTSILLGLAMGSGTVFSIKYGQKDDAGLKEGILASFVLLAGVTAVLVFAVYAGFDGIIWFLRIPAEIDAMMRTYLRIVFAGLAATFLYNYFASLLRALGNSVVPLVFLAVSAGLNIVLDLWFVCGLGRGVAGAAEATVIAQYVSGVGIALYTWFGFPLLRAACRAKLRPARIKEIASFSALTCIQQSVMNLGILAVQGLVNSFGTVVMAAFAAAVKIDAFAYLPVQDFGNAFSIFLAQNYGAQEKGRLKQGMRGAFAAAAGFSVAVSAVVYGFAAPLMRIFIDAGVMYPTRGTVAVNGEIAPLIELGAGFDLDLTARENVFLNGAVLGHDRTYMEEHFKNIIDFAELWDFVDVPVKNYSSGMIARLGFSIATEVKADILACDEILSVGDFMFQQKCHQRMEQMLSGGTTLLFVSHDINQVKQLCKRAIWIDHGHIRGDGPAEEVCNAYVEAMQRGE